MATQDGRNEVEYRQFKRGEEWRYATEGKKFTRGAWAANEICTDNIITIASRISKNKKDYCK